MVSGTFVLTDTIDKAFDAIFSESYANTDAAISGKAPDICSRAAPPRRLRCRRACSTMSASSTASKPRPEACRRDGDEDSQAGREGDQHPGCAVFGFGIDPEQSQFNPLKLVEGTWPSAPDEVVIDAGTADEQGYGVGDSVKIATLKPVQDFRVSGVAQYGSVSSLGTATFAVFTIPTAQQLLDREGSFDAISVAAADGVTPEQLVEDIEPILPTTAQVVTGVEEAEEQRARSPSSRASSATSCSPSAPLHCSWAPSSSSTPCRSRSRSGRASWRRSGRSAPRGSRSAAPCSSRRSSSG